MPPPIFAIGEKLVKAFVEELPEYQLRLNKMDLGKSHWNDYEGASLFESFPGNFISVGDALAK